jgi:hypothetical protein
MPPTAEDRLRDILEAIAEIDKMLAAILSNSLPTKCVEWRLSVISKSSASLPRLNSFVKRHIQAAGK